MGCVAKGLIVEGEKTAVCEKWSVHVAQQADISCSSWPLWIRIELTVHRKTANIEEETQKRKKRNVQLVRLILCGLSLSLSFFF